MSAGNAEPASGVRREGEATESAADRSAVPAIQAKNVWKIFGSKTPHYARLLKSGEELDPDSIHGTAAVVNASFEVKRGETFVVMGLSGSGKSTLLRTLNGLNPATAGDVLINGQALTGVSKQELRRIRRDELSMVFQHFALLPHKTVLDNVAYGLEVRGVDRKSRYETAMRWIERVDLTGNEGYYPDQLSGGMRQRVGLARALAAETDILLMDEAFSALDPLIRADLQQQLLDLQEELGKTIVFITHDLNEAMRLGDRIAIMKSGRIVQLGTTTEILHSPADDYVRRFTHDVDRSRVLTAGMVVDKTAPTFKPDESAEEVCRRLEAAGHTAGSVLEGGKVLGVVHLRNVRSATGTIREVVNTAEPVGRYTPIAELFGRAAEQIEPLAITDRDGTLLGLLSQDRMLDSMSGSDTSGGHA